MIDNRAWATGDKRRTMWTSVEAISGGGRGGGFTGQHAGGDIHAAIDLHNVPRFRQLLSPTVLQLSVVLFVCFGTV